MDKKTEQRDGIREKWTENFLAAYELKKQLAAIGDDEIVSETTPEEDAAAREECAKRVRPFDGGVAAGQVRMQWGPETPTYVLVARKWDETSWLVIPFSPFSAPATETEMKAKTDGGLGLRVLQLWNAFSLLTETLERSWLVHTLPEEETRDALDAWRWTVGVGELTEEQLLRTGLPITNRNDPRVEYRKGEIGKFSKLLAEDLALAERRDWEAVVREKMADRTRVPFRLAEAFEPDYALAAASMPEPVSADCRIPGFEGSVHVKYSPSERTLTVLVFGADGESSGALDGWGVFGSSSALLGTIADASFSHRFSSQFDGILSLSDGEEAVCPLLADSEEG